MSNVDNTEDFIDTRDLIARIDEIQDEQDSLVEEYTDAKEEAENAAEEEGRDWEPTERLCDAINALSRFWDITPEEVDDSVQALDNPADDFNGDEELTSLKKFAEQIEGYADDYYHGETLIRESYFTEYTEELVKDCYGLPSDLPSWIVIDWDATAENIKVDYNEADFDGVTYYFR